MLAASRIAALHPNGVPWLAFVDLPHVAVDADPRLAASLGLPSSEAWLLTASAEHAIVNPALLLELGIVDAEEAPSGILLRGDFKTLDELGALQGKGLGIDSIEAMALLAGSIEAPGTTILASLSEEDVSPTGVIAFSRCVRIAADRAEYGVEIHVVAATSGFAFAALLAGFRRQALCDMEALAAAHHRNRIERPIACVLHAGERWKEPLAVEHLLDVFASALPLLFGPDAEYAPAGMSWDRPCFVSPCVRAGLMVDATSMAIH